MLLVTSYYYTMNTIKIIVSLCFCSIFIGNLYAQNIDNIIREQFEDVKKRSQYTDDVELRIVESGKISSQGDGIIVVSHEQINKILNAIPQHLQKHAIRFVLAHELAHQFQFKYYEKSNRLDHNSLSIMILEAQADILAGFAWVQLIFDEIAVDGKTSFSETDMDKFLNFILDLGIEEHAIGMHPSKNDRLMAAKHGALLGQLAMVEDLRDLDPVNFKKAYGSYSKGIEKINATYKSMDYKVSNKRENPLE